MNAPAETASIELNATGAAFQTTRKASVELTPQGSTINVW